MKQNFLDFYNRMADEMSRKHGEAQTSKEAEHYAGEVQTYLKLASQVEQSIAKEQAKNA